MDINIYFCCYPHTLRSSVLPYMVKKENNKEKNYDMIPSKVSFIFRHYPICWTPWHFPPPSPVVTPAFLPFFAAATRKLWHCGTTALQP